MDNYGLWEQHERLQAERRSPCIKSISVVLKSTWKMISTSRMTLMRSTDTPSVRIVLWTMLKAIITSGLRPVRRKHGKNSKNNLQ